MTDATADQPAGSPVGKPAVAITVHTRGAVRSDRRDPVPVQVVQVFGEVDRTATELLAAMLVEALAGAARVGAGGVVVDATAMTFCGARGLGVLLRTAKLAAELDVGYALTGLSPHLAHLVTMHGPWPPQYPHRATAITAVGLGPPWPVPTRRSPV